MQADPTSYIAMTSNVRTFIRDNGVIMQPTLAAAPCPVSSYNMARPL